MQVIQVKRLLSIAFLNFARLGLFLSILAWIHSQWWTLHVQEWSLAASIDHRGYALIAEVRDVDEPLELWITSRGDTDHDPFYWQAIDPWEVEIFYVEQAAVVCLTSNYADCKSEYYAPAAFVHVTPEEPYLVWGVIQHPVVTGCFTLLYSCLAILNHYRARDMSDFRDKL